MKILKILFVSFFLISCSKVSFTSKNPPADPCENNACIQPTSGETVWQVGAWDLCSQSCGYGNQSRTVVCLNSEKSPIPDGQCKESKPASIQACNVFACAGKPSWNIGSWGTCSMNCGGGEQTRTVECRDSTGVKNNNECTEAMPALTQTCNIQSCECPKVSKNIDITIPEDKNKVDLLLVVDDSSSMGPDNLKLAERLGGFVRNLENSNLDWQMCVTTTDVGYYEGRPIVWSGTNKRVLNKSAFRISEIFQQTIVDIGSGYSSDEQGIKASVLSILNNPLFPCYRNGAALAVIIISDEDERSVGDKKELSSSQYQPLGSQNFPVNYINTARAVFGPEKRIAVNSIVVRDNQCKQNQDTQGSPSYIGLKYMELASLTNGTIGNICDSDYSPNLNYFKDAILSKVSNIDLTCTPIGSPTVEVPSEFSWSLLNTNLNFTPALTGGVHLKASYQCCQPGTSNTVSNPNSGTANGGTTNGGTSSGGNSGGTIGGTQVPSPTNTLVPMSSPTLLPTSTVTPMASSTPVPSISPIVTNSPVPSASPTATPVPTNTVTVVSGKIYYVSPSGLDTNSGLSLSVPLKTINAAFKKAVDGDGIYVLTGTYNEIVTVSENNLLFSAYPNNFPIIDGGTNLPKGDWGSLLTIDGNNNTIYGFEVRNSNTKGSFLGGYGIEVMGVHNKLTAMKVHHTWETGVLVHGDYNIVEDSSVYQASLNQSQPSNLASKTSGWATGMSAARNNSPTALVKGITYHTIFRRNKVYNNWGEGLSCFEANDCTIEDNIVYDNWTINLYLSDTSNSLIQRNIIYVSSQPAIPTRKNSHPGLTLADELSNKPRSTNNKVINNFVYNAGIDGFSWSLVPNSGLNNVIIAYNTIVDGDLSTGGPADQIVNKTSQIRNNIIYGRTSDVPTASGITFSNNNWLVAPTLGKSSSDVIGDPLILRGGSTTPGNLTSAYFKISSASPVTNAGVVIPGFGFDYFGVSRGTTPDLGGHEARP